MEAGGVDEVIKTPQHPYTQLLVDSIPWPDLSRRWGQTDLEPSEDSIIGQGCKFYARCSRAMEICKTRPPLFKLEPYQTASCFLFQDKPQQASEQLSAVLPV